MLKLIPSKRFERNLKVFIKKHPELTPEIKERLEQLQKNPRNPRLKVHRLTGKLKGLLGASLTYEYRLVFYLEDDAIYLITIGTHDEVY